MKIFPKKPLVILGVLAIGFVITILSDKVVSVHPYVFPSGTTGLCEGTEFPSACDGPTQYDHGFPIKYRFFVAAGFHDVDSFTNHDADVSNIIKRSALVEDLVIWSALAALIIFSSVKLKQKYANNRN